jgi:hypothetical protein
VHLGIRNVLPSEFENKLVPVLHKHGPEILWTETSVQKTMAFQLTIRNGLQHPFNQEKSAAENKWLRSFFKSTQYDQ